MERRRILLIGATSLIAEACAHLWADASAVDFVLVGRELTALERIAANLQIRHPRVTATPYLSDFTDPKKIQETVSAIAAQGALDIALIAQGLLPDQKACQQELLRCNEVLTVTGLSPVLFAEAIAQEMEKASRGTLAVISSVAGDRGRQSNYIYGAAKSLVSCYVEGLQHRFAATKVRVILIKPGPTATPMTHSLQRKGARLAPVSVVAQQIVTGIDQNVRVLYTPKIWAWIMRLVRHIPTSIFHKLKV